MIARTVYEGIIVWQIGSADHPFHYLELTQDPEIVLSTNIHDPTEDIRAWCEASITATFSDSFMQTVACINPRRISLDSKPTWDKRRLVDIYSEMLNIKQNKVDRIDQSLRLQTKKEADKARLLQEFKDWIDRKEAEVRSKTLEKLNQFIQVVNADFVKALEQTIISRDWDWDDPDISSKLAAEQSLKLRLKEAEMETATAMGKAVLQETSAWDMPDAVREGVEKKCNDARGFLKGFPFS
ncbi:hypothetical protein [Chroococcidiopsis sp.]|uniref:hypothetical protein n=1 Tax=Chroococcidiopsis sp. TaxID=3088168 RepID=UPI003F33166A